MLANTDSILLTTPDAATILAATTRLSRRKQETEPADEGVVQEAQ